MKRYKVVEKATAKCVASLELGKKTPEECFKVIAGFVKNVSNNTVRFCREDNEIYFYCDSKEWKAFIDDNIVYVEHIEFSNAIKPIGPCSADENILAELKYDLAKLDRK